VIDFIDMLAQRNQRDVENTLRDAMRADRARVQIGKIDRFGLLSLSRQRLHPSLKEFSHELCPRCSGQGTIRGIEPLTLAILRLVEDEAIRHYHKNKKVRIIAQLPVEVATYMLNEKREDVARIESEYKTHILAVPNANIETPRYKIECFEIIEDEPFAKASYKLVERFDSEGLTDKIISTSMATEAALENFMPTPEKKEGFVKRFFSSFVGSGAEEEEEIIEEVKKPEPIKPARKPKAKSQASTKGRGSRDDSNQTGSGDARRRKPKTGGERQQSRGTRQDTSESRTDRKPKQKKHSHDRQAKHDHHAKPQHAQQPHSYPKSAKPPQSRTTDDEFAKQFDEFANEVEQKQTPQTTREKPMAHPPPPPQESFSAKDAGLNRDWDDVSTPTDKGFAPEVEIKPAESVASSAQVKETQPKETQPKETQAKGQQSFIVESPRDDVHEVSASKQSSFAEEGDVKTQPQTADVDVMEDVFKPEQHARPSETGQKDHEAAAGEKKSRSTTRHHRGRGRTRRGRKH